MSIPVLLEGFTAAPDEIRDDIDTIAALVFGVVWRYTHMERRQCDASVKTISERVGFGTTATRKRLRILEERGWIVSEVRDGKTTVYQDAGKWQIKVSGERVTGSTPTRGVAVPQREALPTPTRGVAAPQREALPTPTPNVAHPNARRCPPQREALPKKEVKKGLKKESKKEDPTETSTPHSPPAGGSSQGMQEPPKWGPLLDDIADSLGVPATDLRRKNSPKPLAQWTRLIATVGAHAKHDLEVARALWSQFAATDFNGRTPKTIQVEFGRWMKTRRRNGEVPAAPKGEETREELRAHFLSGLEEMRS